MLEGTSAPIPESVDPSQPAASRIYRALGSGDWDSAMRVIENDWPRLGQAEAKAARAALLAMPAIRRVEPRWQRLASVLTDTPFGTAQLDRGAAHRAPIIGLAATAIRSQHSGDLIGSMRAVDSARLILDVRVGAGRDDDAQIARALMACADIASCAMRFSDALAFAERGYSFAREIDDSAVAIGCASSIALLHAFTGRTVARDIWMACANDLVADAVHPAEVTVPLTMARLLEAVDRLDVAAAREILDRSPYTDAYALDIALRTAAVDALDVARDPADALYALDGAVRVAPHHVSRSPLRQISVAIVRSQLLAREGRLQAGRDALHDAENHLIGDEGRAELAAFAAVAELSCRDLDAALRHAYIATERPGQPRAVTIGAAVTAACLIERRHPDAMAACERAIALADENALPSALTVLPRRDLKAVLSFAPENSATTQLVSAALVGGALRVTDDIAPVPVTLSPSELAVLRLLAGGSTSGRIAMSMRVSVNTVRTHMRHIYRKLAVTNRADLVKAATDHGLL